MEGQWRRRPAGSWPWWAADGKRPCGAVADDPSCCSALRSEAPNGAIFLKHHYMRLWTPPQGGM